MKYNINGKNIFKYGYIENDGILYKQTQYGIRFVTDDKNEYKFCVCTVDDMFSRGEQ